MPKRISAIKTDATIVQSKNTKQKNTAPMPYFPLFVCLAAKPVVIIGAGNIALRRIHTLLQFGACLRVIAPQINEEIQRLANEHAFVVEERPYQQGDCAGAVLTVAATDAKAVNRAVAAECAANNIPVSVADDQTACTFFFPAIVKKGNLVIGITSGGENHTRVRKVAAKLRQQIDWFDEPLD